MRSGPISYAVAASAALVLVLWAVNRPAPSAARLAQADVTHSGGAARDGTALIDDKGTTARLAAALDATESSAVDTAEPRGGAAPTGLELTVRGVVVDEAGAPLADVEVAAERDRWSAFPDWSLEPRRGARLTDARTDRDGRFELALESPELTTVRAQTTGRVAGLARGVAPGAELRIVLAPAATLAGYVLTAGERAPVRDALVRVHEGAEQAELVLAHTDAAGAFSVAGLTPGIVGVIVVPLAEVASRWREVELAAGRTTRIEVEVARGWTLAGRVRDARSGDFIGGARVSAWDLHWKNTETDDQGRFRIEGVATRPGTLVADAPGYGRKELAFDAERDDLDVALTRALRLEGRIVDTIGAPIAGATAVATARQSSDGLDQREWRDATTDDGGRFVLDGVRADLPLFLQARAAGHGARVVAVATPSDEATTVALGDVVLAPQAILAGRVVTAEGAPVADAFVELLGEAPVAAPADAVSDAQREVQRRGATTDALGRFFFTELAAGRWRLTARAPGGGVAERELELRAAAPLTDLVVALPGGATVRGVVRDDVSGEGVADASVVLSVIDPTSAESAPGLRIHDRSTTSDAAGAFEFTALPDIEWRARAYVPDDTRVGDPRPPDTTSGQGVSYGAASAAPVVANGALVELRLPRLDNEVQGRAVDARGAAVPDLFVALAPKPGDSPHSGALSDADGRFLLRTQSSAAAQVQAWRTAPLVAGQELRVLDWRMGRRVLLEAGVVAQATVAQGAAEVTLLVPAP